MEDRTLEQKQEEARQSLREVLQPGDQVFVVVGKETPAHTWFGLYVATMEKRIIYFRNEAGETVTTEAWRPSITSITYQASLLVPWDLKDGYGIKVGGYQTNRANDLVSKLAARLFGDHRNLKRVDL